MRGGSARTAWLVLRRLAVVAVLVAGVLTLVFGRPEGRDGVDYGLGQVFGYLALILGIVGALVGGLVAVVAGARGERRRRHLWRAGLARLRHATAGRHAGRFQ